MPNCKIEVFPLILQYGAAAAELGITAIYRTSETTP
jgi:hypothetical protein